MYKIIPKDDEFSKLYDGMHDDDQGEDEGWAREEIRETIPTKVISLPHEDLATSQS